MKLGDRCVCSQSFIWRTEAGLILERNAILALRRKTEGEAVKFRYSRNHIDKLSQSHGVEIMEVKEKSEMREEIKQPYFYQGTQWKWGFNPSAEIWNGRLAMVGFLAATLIEIFTGHGYLQFLGFLTGTNIAP